jgi:hypothetical protein
MKFRIVCAWCGKVEQDGSPNAPTSHTICESCAVMLLATIEEKAA